MTSVEPSSPSAERPVLPPARADGHASPLGGAPPAGASIRDAEPGELLQRRALFGLLCSVAGLGFGLWVSFTPNRDGWGSFFVASTAASFLAGFLAWWLVVGSRPQPSVARGAVAGVCAAVLGHPLSWLLFFAFAPQIDGVLGLLYVLALFSFFSFWYVGGPSAMVGMALGALLARHISPPPGG
jgi:hypothetical protein